MRLIYEDILEIALLLLFVAVFSSCSLIGKNEDTGASDSPKLANVQARAATYVKLLGNPYKIIDRCDRLTHIGHYNAAAQVSNMLKHEYDVNADGSKTYKTGQLHRDLNPCNTNSGAEGPEMDSRSEVSKENILAFFHDALSRNDTETILRVIRRARDHDWCFATGGDDKYNCASEFAPLLNDWEDKLTGKLTLAEESDAIAIPALEGFRGNTMHSYILLKGRAFGYLRGAELEVIDSLIATEPLSPLYKATKHRFTDGDQSEALASMTSSQWPLTDLPSEDIPDFHWQGSIPAMLYVWTVAVLEGK